MTSEEILDKLNDIFHDVLDDDSLVIVRETTAADVDDWDSLSHINLIVAIEQDFSLKFRLEELEGLKCVGDMVDLVAAKTS